MPFRAELHCHSTLSDGSFAPEEVARRAKASGVRLFCLTDHDTFAGYEPTAEVLDGECIVLRGVELSCKEFGRTVHLLIYGLTEGPALDAFRGRLRTVHSQRLVRLRAICERLSTLGIRLDVDQLVVQSHGRSPGRPDVARALVEAGVCSSTKEAFVRYLRDGGPAYVDVDRFSVADGVALGKAAGGRMAIAHPHTLGGLAPLRGLFRQLRDDGLEGIEAHYGRYTPGEQREWVRFAQEFDLVTTGGSDFHGDLTPDIAGPGLDLPDAVAERVCRWLDVRA
ncbi:MAG: PHP domain-containing protein [Myxococcota bacterium]